MRILFIPSIKTAIEYDGAYFHSNRKQADLRKNQYFESRKIDLLRIRELPLERLTESDLLVSSDALTKYDLNSVVQYLGKKIHASEIQEKISAYLKLKNFANEGVFKEYISFFPSPFPENSIIATNPEIIELWHEKNYPLKPSNFSKGSKQTVWWRCDINQEHEWEAPISTLAKGHRCPICAGQKVTKSNSLESKFPNLFAEWHPTKNMDLSPRDISWGSGKKVWWKCPAGDDHEWQAQVRHRTSNNSGCPFCSGNKISSDNNFGTVFPELAKEWHPQKNMGLSPYDVMPKTKLKVWWLCPMGHSYELSVGKRTSRNQNCTVCYRKSIR